MPLHNYTAFIKALRGAGVAVSPAEAEDGLRALLQLGYESRPALRSAWSQCLAKDDTAKQQFFTTFDQYFRPPLMEAAAVPLPAPPPAAADQAFAPGQSGQGGGGQGGQGSQGEGQGQGEGGELVAALLADDQPALSAALARAAAEAGLWQIRVITQKGLFARRMLVAMGIEQVDEQLLTWARAGHPRAAALRAARTALQRRALAEVEQAFALQGREEGERLREWAMRTTDLRHLHEFRDVERLIQRMARKLAARHGRRKRRAKRGELDVRRTVQASMHTDGIPMTLVWRARPRRRPKVWVICDVSSSVATASRFLLMFLYALNDVLPAVRSFAFAARSGEVTHYFNDGQLSASQAVARVLDDFAGSGTDYASMLEQFWQQHQVALDPHATVIILGDARNNGLPAGQQWLERIAERSARVLWLNPEARNRWGSGDSEMPAYQPYCRMAVSCRTLQQLELFVDQLLRELD